MNGAIRIFLRFLADGSFNFLVDREIRNDYVYFSHFIDWTLDRFFFI